jgi:hypothetical protein
MIVWFSEMHSYEYPFHGMIRSLRSLLWKFDCCFSLQMSKSRRDTLLQGTFNATLDNPLSEEQAAQKAPAGKKRTAFVIGV